VGFAYMGFRLLRHHSLLSRHVTDAALRQDRANDHALLAVLSSKEKRQHVKGVNLPVRRGRTADIGPG
jgi:hypothetical protein